ncbi:potassium/sodium hyperpolarization-activated cyclic nucleotide-gated channel 2-like isoform X2 [Armigeres subalbatus]|uniref:potassium/sodium hyperpolarization-activated cyclic nucleotide-gated channel 2-like isoform X2 n=1 Tax=Armigeres subalbatus TaxID=124917 RepID=UPI002ED2B54D
MNPSTSKQSKPGGNRQQQNNSKYGVAGEDDPSSMTSLSEEQRELLDEVASKKVPSMGFPNHDCKTGHNIDLLRAFVPGESFVKRISRWFRRMCYLDQSSALSQEVFRSDTARKREISRHISFYSGTIHPFSYLRFCWECIMIVTFFTAFIFIPYDVIFLFRPEDYHPLTWFHHVVLTFAICLIDICFSIRTGYYDHERQYVQLDPCKIANQYVLMWFWIDLISSFPDPLVTRYIVSKKALQYSIFDCLREQNFHFGCFWDFWNVLSMLKMFRMATFLRYISNVYRRYKLRRNVMKFTTIATVLVLTLHWGCCVMFMVARIRHGTDPDLVDKNSWVSQTDIWHKSPFHQYIECFFRTLYMMGLVTHSMDQFMTDDDIIVSLIFCIFGYFLKIYVLAELLIFMRIMFSSTSMYYEHRHELQDYIRSEQLPHDMEQRILCYHDHRISNRYSRKTQIDVCTGKQFHLGIREVICGQLVKGISLFRDTLTPEMFRWLMLNIQYQLFLKDDILVKASEGSDGAKLVMVIQGTVAVFTPNWREVLHLEDGEHFGEYQLALGSPLMKYSNIVAVETSEVYLLSRPTYVDMLLQFPALEETITALAQDRYETLAALEREVVIDTIQEAETIRRTKFFS